ncbi:hypothetical protein Clacol_002660 [Clathrus columnatus]|uniref:GATA-type domain-containing protein n=1 Tax=Clathrus columnatus TaxID=1419009 RepID=A0AAV5A1F2_9AGAM|nr:hypothetical protein Clacol_002660 [Clathrus columnatus]
MFKHTLRNLARRVAVRWTLLTEDLRFLYVDPVLSSHLGPQAHSIIGRTLLEFIHPDEHSSASVRYSRLGRTRVRLGFTEAANTLPEEEKVLTDDSYMACDLVINWAADNLVLCFIHAVVDMSPADNDEVHRTPWSNWCGTPDMDVEDSTRLYRALSPIAQSYPEHSSPTRIFQILKNTTDRVIVFSWPTHGYDPKEYQKLANDVQIGGANGSDAKTSCTRRYKALQNLPYENGWTREVESIFIPHEQIIFACHKSTLYRPRGSFPIYSHLSHSYESSEHGYCSSLPASQAETFSNGHSYGYPASHSSHLTQTSLLPSERLSSTSPDAGSRGHHNFESPSSWNSLTPLTTSQASSANEQYVSFGSRQSSIYADVVPPPRQRGMRATLDEKGSRSRDTYNSMSNKGNPPAGIMRCVACKSTTSPEWRKGPSGKKDLCNACGLRYSRAKAKKEGTTSRRRKDVRAPALPALDTTRIKRRSSEEDLYDLSIDNSYQKTSRFPSSSPPRDFPHSHSIPASPTAYTYPSIEPRPNSMYVYSHPTPIGVIHDHSHRHSDYQPTVHNSYVSTGSPVLAKLTRSPSTSTPSLYGQGLSSEHRIRRKQWEAIGGVNCLQLVFVVYKSPREIDHRTSGQISTRSVTTHARSNVSPSHQLVQVRASPPMHDSLILEFERKIDDFQETNEKGHHDIDAFLSENEINLKAIPSLKVGLYAVNRIIYPTMLWDNTPELLDLLSLSEIYRQRIVTNSAHALQWNRLYSKKGLSEVVDGKPLRKKDVFILENILRRAQNSVLRETYRNLVLQTCSSHIYHLRQSNQSLLIPLFFMRYFPSPENMKPDDESPSLPIWLRGLSIYEILSYKAMRLQVIKALEEIQSWEDQQTELYK